MKEEFFQGPVVISQSSSQSGSILDPMKAVSSHRKAETQALVKVTEIVDAAEDVHARLQGGVLASEMRGAAEQASQMLAEGGIEPSDVGGCVIHRHRFNSKLVE